MSEIRVRSKTGCLTCKNRRKKCDETRPACQRCKRAGMECLGYSYLDDPAYKPRLESKTKRRTPTESGTPSSITDFLQQSIASSSLLVVPGDHPIDLVPDLPQSNVMPPGETWSFPHNLPEAGYPGHNFIATLNEPPHASLLSGQLSLPQPDAQDAWWNTSLGPSGHNLGVPQFLRLLNDQPPASRSPNVATADQRHTPAEEADILHALLGLGDSQTSANPSSYATSRESSFQGSVAPSPAFEWADNLSNDDEDEDSDTEGVMSTLGPTLALDRTAPSNTLPFIVSSYLRWAIRTLFEPLKVARGTRDHLVKRFMRSDDTRCGTTLVASIMESRLRDSRIGASYSPDIRTLESRVYHRLAIVKSVQEPLPDSHASDVLTTLHDSNEVGDLRFNRSFTNAFRQMIAVICQARPLSHFMKLLREITPVYRMACPEPVGVPVHLPAKLLHPEPVLRQFPAIDILMSLNSGLPMLLQYDVTDIPGLYDHVHQVNNFGLQWMYGVPDQFLVMLARMHILRDNSAPNVDSRIISELETEIHQFKPAPDDSPDSYLRVARLMVQESWRQTMYIYLYMGLCGATSNDTRVEGAMKKFTRLLEGVRPGRTPDIFLVIPMTAVSLLVSWRQSSYQVHLARLE
ncbi:hypothetical protein FRC12_009402 [Ceratobasidium sp. 428]|nr:hypothetical protein FRC12_009402 [Ceratobasidium sp. 428]